MHIDRTRFLLLASAIAACAPRKGADPPVTTVSDPDAGAPPPVATAKEPEGVVAAPWSAKESPPPVYEGGGGWTPPPSGEGYYPPPSKEGGYYPPSNAEGGGSTGTLKGMGVPVASWTCSGSDDAGKPAYCAIKVPKSCAPFPFVHQSCNGARKYFKPKIAERAVSCMHKLTPQAVCSAMTYECRDAAMRSACPDPQADMECQALSKKCPKMSLTECRMYMNGLNAMGRAEVIKCMSTGSGCSYGVYSCTEGLND